MTGITHFETFLLTGLLLNLTPGNDTIFILSKSIAQGKKAGIVSALGISTGCVVHTILAAFGLSVIIAQSVMLFTAIKYAGAIYLLYMGVQMLRSNASFNASATLQQTKPSYNRIYRDGIITNVLNPKVALFFMAFLPQFINPEAQHTALPFLLLGITFVLTGTLWCLVLAFFASAIFVRLKNNSKIAGYINKCCGITLIALGIKVALSDKK
ncbi:LysE family translocator [Emticicia sp. 17c]|uniref:LysE family translocator n=1 Tax=Emticicia sp. 17c TaxID=3127704 RepID=UPI00301B9F09